MTKTDYMGKIYENVKKASKNVFIAGLMGIAALGCPTYFYENIKPKKYIIKQIKSPKYLSSISKYTDKELNEKDDPTKSYDLEDIIFESNMLKCKIPESDISVELWTPLSLDYSDLENNKYLFNSKNKKNYKHCIEKLLNPSINYKGNAVIIKNIRILNNTKKLLKNLYSKYDSIMKNATDTVSSLKWYEKPFEISYQDELNKYAKLIQEQEKRINNKLRKTKKIAYQIYTNELPKSDRFTLAKEIYNLNIGQLKQEAPNRWKIFFAGLIGGLLGYYGRKKMKKNNLKLDR